MTQQRPKNNRLPAIVVRLTTWALTWALALALPLSGQKVARSSKPSLSVGRQLNMVMINNRPTPLFWAEGLADPADLELYEKLGLNTVLIRIRDLKPESQKRHRALLDRASEKGLSAMIALSPGEWEGEGLPVTPLDAGYRAAVQRFVRQAVSQFKGSPALMGWLVEGVDPLQVSYSDRDFQGYLQVWYKDLDSLNQAWGGILDEWYQVTLAAAVALDKKKIGGWGIASIDLACYYRQAYQDLLAVWAREVHAVDRDHLMLAGIQNSYKTMISVPGEYDGMVIGLYPGLVENDPLTHNVHGVDIARQANRFVAVPTFNISGGVTPTQLSSWIAEAVVHGAGGFACWNWDILKQREDLRQTLTANIKFIEDQNLCPLSPLPRVAVIYEPFAPGYLVNGRPIYGYMAWVAMGEPADLFFSLRTGTAYGQVDYISEEMLSRSKLDNYGVILAPQALYLSPESQQALGAYVANGGVLVADFGVGMYQAGGTPLRLTPTLQQIFGIREITDVTKRDKANFAVWTPHPLFPSLKQGAVTSGIQGDATFSGLMGVPSLETDVVPVLARPLLGTAAPGILLRQVGKGFGIYTATRLWQNWLPGSRLFAEFHGDLFSRGSEIRLIQPQGFLAPAEVALYADGSIGFLNKEAGVGEVAVQDATGALYQAPSTVQVFPGPQGPTGCRLLFARGGMTLAKRLPVKIVPMDGSVIVRVKQYGPDQIELWVYGQGATISPREGDLEVTGQGKTKLLLLVENGRYRVASKSHHQLTVQDLESGSTLQLLQSAAKIGLAFEVEVKATRLLLRPG